MTAHDEAAIIRYSVRGGPATTVRVGATAPERVALPDWWPSWYPRTCPNGHVWGPGLVTMSWTSCHCAGTTANGHHAAYCGKCSFHVWPPEHDASVDLDADPATWF